MRLQFLHPYPPVGPIDILSYFLFSGRGISSDIPKKKYGSRSFGNRVREMSSSLAKGSNALDDDTGGLSPIYLSVDNFSTLILACPSASFHGISRHGHGILPPSLGSGREVV